MPQRARGSAQKMESEKWFVTWRHTDRSPLEALVTMVDSEEEGEKLQAKYLNEHETNFCAQCWHPLNTEDIPLGDNANIVTRVRTERAVYRTLGFK